MTQKFKKLLKNEKGFTLVELLAVIVILGIILAIAVPAIGNIISDSEGKADVAEQELILDAARLADVNEDFTSGTTDVQDLIDSGYLDKVSDTSLLDDVIYKDGGKFTFTAPSTP